MSYHHTFLITSLLLYSTASFANEEIEISKTRETTVTPWSYQTELNEYSFADNVCIDGTSTPLLQNHPTVQSDSNRPLVFLGNRFSLTMNQLSNPASGACIYSPESIHLQEFSFFTLTCCTNLASEQSSPYSGMLCSDQNIVFDKNISTIFHKNTASGCGGVLKAKEIAFHNTASTVSFTENAANENGGALCGETILLSKQVHLTLANNQAKQSGGALYVSAPDISSFSDQHQNQCVIEYAYQANIMNNQALEGNGGAIYSTGNNILQGIACLQAKNNQASSSQDLLGNGGAIYSSNINAQQDTSSPSELHIRNNSIVAFTDNSARRSGGAIYGDQINIDQNVGVYFFRNQAKYGGAIAVSNIGSISLQTESGAIVFQGNKEILNQDSYTYNAIHLDPQAHLSHLSTKANGGIFFYDPIVQEPLPIDATPHTLVINAKTDEETLSGSVVFSGKYISKEEKRFQENITSTLHHHVILDSGDLYLEENARLKVQSFKQNKEAKLHVQPNTLLSTEQGLHVTHLEFPLQLINGQDVAYFATNETHDAPLSIEGTLSFVDSNNTFYENHALLNYEETWIPLVEAYSASNQIEQLPIKVQGDVSAPYGYQGSWNIEWRDSDQPNTKQLCAHWKKSAYTPHPERITELVANSLWNTRADLFAIHELLEMKALAEPYSLGVWGAATSSFFHKTIDKQLPVDRSAWKHRSCGYMIGINSHSLSDHVLGFAAGQLYGHSEDHLITTEQRCSYVISAFAKISTPILTVSGNAAYNKTYHTLSTHYHAFQDEGIGNWESQCFSGDITSAIVMKLSENSRLFHSLSFFAKARLFDGTQLTFDETNQEARTFSNNYLRVLSTPFGVCFESRTKRHGMFYNASLAYSQDIYKENSALTTTLLANQANWSTEMANFDKHAFLFQVSHHRTFKYLQLFANFSGEIRKNSQIYSLDLGSTCKF